MAGVVHATWEGGRQTATLDKRSAQEVEVIYDGDDDVNAASSAISSWLSPFVPDLFTTLGYLELNSFGPVERIAPGTFRTMASYVDPEGQGAGGRGAQRNPPALGEFKLEWDVGEERVKRTFSETGKWTAYVDPAYADPNPHGAIGIKKANDGKLPTVEGVEVRVAKLKFSIYFRIPRANVNPSQGGPFVRNLRSKEFHRNDKTFLSFAPKELLFTGASGSGTSFGDPEIKFDFEADTTETLTIGSIPVITKPPHDYLDIVWNTEADNTNKVMKAKPIAAYVHQLYGTTSFPALFGFGP